MSINTQLTTAIGYDTSRMIFSDPIQGSIPDSKPAISFYRININTRNEDGSMGELIIPTIPELFSFGVSENTSQETGNVNGYSLPICLFNRDGPTEDQKAWVDTFDRICEKCKDHVMATKEDIGKYDLERTELKKFNSLHWKREKGKIVEGTGPTLYAKLIVSKKQDNKIVTMFFDFDGNIINPLDLQGKFGHTNAAIKIESIFIGNKISLQVKLYECEFRVTEMGMKRLLSRPQANSKVLIQSSTSATSHNPLSGKESDDEVGSLHGEDDDEDKQVEVAQVKKVVRKVKKIVKKSSSNDEE